VHFYQPRAYAVAKIESTFAQPQPAPRTTFIIRAISNPEQCFLALSQGDEGAQWLRALLEQVVRGGANSVSRATTAASVRMRTVRMVLSFLGTVANSHALMASFTAP